MGEKANAAEIQRDERIIVAVTDVGVEDRGQASMIDDRVRAQKIVKSLVEHGVEAEAVSALRGREIPLDVSYRWMVELVDVDAERERRRRSVLGRTARLLVGGLKFLHDIAPARPFDLRIDRLVWVGLWTVSLAVLAISLVASMSSGAAREIVVEIPVEQFQGGTQSPVAASPVLPSPPVASPLSQDAANDDAPVVGGAARLPECVAGGIDDCTCADFQTQPVAQAFYEANPPGPGQIVDPDGNGVMCEWLPKR